MREMLSSVVFLLLAICPCRGYQKTVSDILSELEPFSGNRLRFRQGAVPLESTSAADKGVKENAKAKLPVEKSEDDEGTQEKKSGDNEGFLKQSVRALAKIFNFGVGDKLPEDLYAMKFNSYHDADALLTALISSVVLLCITLLIFSGVRLCCPMVYSHRVLAAIDTGAEEVVPAKDDGIFGWISAALHVTQDEVMAASGLDALMFLEFIRMFQLLTLLLVPIAGGVLIPMHMAHGKASSDHPTDWLTPLGMGGLAHAEYVPPAMHWTYSGMAWLVVGLTLFLTYRTHQNFLVQRFKWLRMIPEPRSTTLMVEGIPNEYRSDSKLEAYFTHLFGEDVIERAYMVRKTRALQGLVGKLEAKEYSLSTAQKQWDDNGNDPDKAPKIGSFSTSFAKAGENAVEVYGDQVAKLKLEVSQERNRIEKAVADGDLAAVATSAFVTFRSQRWCRLASREQYREDASQWVLGMPPDPSDVVYHDFVKDEDEQARGNCMGTAMVVLLFLLWTPLVAFSTALTSLPSFEARMPRLRTFLEAHPTTASLLQGVLATFALKFLMSWFPTFMMLIIGKFYTLKSGAWAQLKLQNRYFIFQVTFVIFVGAVGITAPKTLEKIVDHPGRILTLLADKLPRASNFYLSYVVIGWFTLSMELLRYIPLLKYIFYTRWYRMEAETAHALSEPEDQDGCGMGARFARTALVMTLTILFSSIAPLIIVFGCIFFFLSNIVYSYLFAFAETKKPDLGGAFWIVSLRHILFALLLYVSLTIGILGSMGESGKWPAAVVAPIYILLYLAWNRFGQFKWEVLPFEILANLDHDLLKHKSPRDAKDIYIQPECREAEDKAAIDYGY